ncbi:hypothetical protein J1N35_029283 [Gossypium stocksii]|uniref:Reverse transcriptase domain-containing protein n=1 Tax=Gossypium stocksii TaxID=47602 RepID=A0A9D3ZRX2_9ROSI|nr:hypothetical protein J1N35_029283 [Gossypium stocksii]
MEYVSTARAAVLVNGTVTNEFRMFRGLHQGDSLSPFLFILVTEVLHLLLGEAEELGVIEGFKDVIPRLSKSSLVGFDTEEEFVFRMVVVCKCKIGDLMFSYLGIPLGADPRRLSSWDGIVERVERKLVGWKTPIAVIKNIDKIRQNFLWGSVRGRRKMAKRFVVDKEALWRKITTAKWTRIESFRWLVGNGRSILFWEDVWCASNKYGLVKDLSLSNGFTEVNWAEFFSHPLLDREIYMVSHLKEAVSSMILFPEVPPRVRSFLWMISIDCLPTKAFLISRGVKLGQFLEKNIGLVRVMVKSLWMISVLAASWYWCPPNYGGVKFNVCGVAFEDEVGCGGVLRNSDRVARALFSGQLTVKGSFVAEVGAISIALDIFLEMGWKDKSGNKMAYALVVVGLKRQGLFKAYW